MSTTKVTDDLRDVTAVDAAKLTGNVNVARLPSTVLNSNVVPEVYGFSVDANGHLIVTTTNSGADNITSATYATFSDTLISVAGCTWTISGTDLIATV